MRTTLLSARTSLLVLFFLGSLLIAGYPGTGEAATLLGTGGEFPRIAANGSNVYVVWNTGSETLLRRSLDAGSSFLPPYNFILDPSIGTAGCPDVAVNGSNVYLVWGDRAALGGRDILLRRSADGGNTFSAPLNLSNTPSNPDEECPKIAVDGSTIHVVWMTGFFDNEKDVMYARSTNGGLTFSAPVNFSNSPGRLSRDPVVAANGSNVFVAWGEEGGEIFMTRSTNGGAIFSSPVNLSNTPEGGSFPNIATDSLGGVFVAWGEQVSGPGTPSEVVLRRSTNSGASFSPLVNVSRTAQQHSGRPSLAVNGQQVFFAWHDFGQFNNPSTLEINFNRSLDGGSTFSLPVNISNTPGVNSENPHLAVSGGSTYVVWQDTNDILFHRNLPVPDPAPRIMNSPYAIRAKKV